jgi:carbamoyltransferase
MDKNTGTIIIGHANSYHDPGIAILWKDKVYAEAFERHTQCKQAIAQLLFEYSWKSFARALKKMGLSTIENVEIVMLSSWDMTDFSKMIPEQLPVKSLLDETGVGDAHFNWFQLYVMLSEPLFRASLAWFLTDGQPSLKTYVPNDPQPLAFIPENNISWQSKSIDHHLAHAANAVYTSTFTECMVVVADGAGEGHGISIYHFEHNEFRLFFRSTNILSLGLLYARVTQLCGFNPDIGEMWKVMGLAAYGKPHDGIYEFFTTRGRNYGKSEGNCIAFEDLFDLEKIVGGFRHHSNNDIMHAADLAHNFQRYFEDKIAELMEFAFRFNLSKNLAYSGGCALNSAANGRILARTGFERLHVPSAPGDEGNSLGIALQEKHGIRKEERKLQIMSPYLGSEMDIGKLEHVLSFGKTAYRRITDAALLCEEVARRLSEGQIIGWIQGQAEFGPRSLGNRSILADPRAANMKEKINSQVKFREWFRPFAPSILHEFGPAYFEDYQESPYMERTLRFRAEVHERVPAVVHVDGTGRLQTVKQEWNPLFHQLVTAFHKITGIPILLNTSLNVMGKPIIHSIDDAITVFYTTGLDCIVVGEYILMKKE